MSLKVETVPARTDLTSSQRALLEERLKRAKQVTSRPAETRSSIPPRPAGADIPLSFAQQRLWFIDQLEPASAVYNVCQVVRIQGPLEVTALQASLDEIIRRHESLRTNFVSAEGQPVQVIASERTITVQRTDLTGLAGTAQSVEIERLLREESSRPFDLARDLLIRALLVKTAATEHTLLLTLHHIISDGWSFGILFRELAALYPALARGEAVSLPELPIQYADYAHWERENVEGPALDRALAYWRKQLEAPLPILELPVDRPRSVARGNRGAAISVQMPRGLAQAAKTLSQAEGATLFMTLLAGFQVLLHRWSGQEDIVIGSVVAGRRKVELEKLIGFFVNTLVFRGDLTGDPTFRQLLGRTREAAVGAFTHQDLPFERLVNELRPDRAASRNPLFQVMFVLQSAPMAPLDMPELTLLPVEFDPGTSKFDLTLSMTEVTDGLRATMEYNADLFERTTIDQMLRSLQTLLEHALQNPDQPVSRLPLVTPAEAHRLLVEWNGTPAVYPQRTVAQLFEEQVAQSPHSVAVTFRGRNLTYLQLDARANQLAHWLRRNGVGPETRVALCVERSVELIVALVAILKAGGTYVSLDPSYPTERLAFMLEDTAAPVILTEAKLRSKLDEIDRAAAGGAAVEAARQARTVLSLDSEWSRIASEPESTLVASTTPDAIAYISYTSGSTGRPKGVCVPHRGVVRLVRNTDYARFTSEEVFLQFAPVAFDASTLEIWGALLNGARLVVYPPGATSLSELGEFIERQRITTLWLTAGLFQQMVEEQIDRLRQVRQLLAGGDVLSPAHVARVLERLPSTQLINGYGPTENTTFTCCHRVSVPPTSGAAVPIGRPIANTTVYILDRHLQLVPPGVPGELYTGGDGLARGYLNRDELTAEKFIPNPFAAATGDPASSRLYRTGDLARWRPDGTIDFLGRVDRQVKIRGFRVEPAEIEAVLATHADVKDCVVAVRGDAAGGKRLVAYVVSKRQPAPTVDVWRQHLAERLPEHLVPSAFCNLEFLPLNANGKVDLQALPEDDGQRPELQGQFVPPRDEIERQLVKIWESVLKVSPIGVRDHFFALGGHSLLAVRMVAQLEKAFGRKLPVAAIFQHRSIEQLAALLRRPSTDYRSSNSIVEICAGRPGRPRLYFVHGVGGGMFWGYANLARYLGGEQPVYAFQSRGMDGEPELSTIEEIAAAYVADLLAHQPEGPYLLGGYCFGGIVAYEMARQLRARGQRVELLALINGSPPNTGYDKQFKRWSPLWQAKFVGNAAYWLSCFLFRWTWREQKEFVRWKLRVLRRRTSESGQQKHNPVALGDVDQLVDLAQYSEERRALWRSHVQALVKYQPGRYDGRVTLIRTRGHPLLCSFDHQYGWGELARGGVEVKVVPGGHGNVLAEPYVSAVAQALEPCLQRIASGSSREVTP